LWLNGCNPVVFDADLHEQHPRQRIALGIVRSTPGSRQVA
jgi:hypothetical protein